MRPPRNVPDSSNFRTDVNSTRESFLQLPKNRGVGTDGISAELLCAGGLSAARLFDSIHQRTLREGWPLRWCGGRIKDIWKHKGDLEDCDNSRGLLLSDHSSKAFVSQLRGHFEPVHEQFAP
eukprot:6999200-Karenia_brevis.AAC.1